MPANAAPLRLFCFGLSDPQWPARVQRLCCDTGVEPVYWTGMQKIQAAVSGAFPGAVFHNMAQAIRGVYPAALTSQPDFHLEPPGEAILKAMEPYQATAIKLMERMDADGRSFTYEERLRHYHRQLRYWLSVFSYLKPDLAFFPIAPHANYDYIAYGLCQALGVQTLLLDRTAIPSRVLYGASIEDTASRLGAAYRRLLAPPRGDDAPALSAVVERYYQNMQGGYAEAMPPNVRRKIERTGLDNYSSGRESVLLCLRYELAGLVRHVQGGGGKLPDNYLKEKRRAPEASDCGYARDAAARILGGLAKGRLRRHYASLQQTPDWDRPYVFVPLHYQPERSSVPSGRWFGDQFLMIDMLSKTLPPGWRLYVKEHSQQWSYFAKGERGRLRSLYDDLRALPNVTLVPVSSPPFDLIDRAKATATVAGSAGWESVMRGRPALVFGNAWYRECEGVFRAQNPDDCARAFTAIERGFAPDAARVRLFLKALDETAIPIVIDTLREDAGDLPPEAMIENFALGIGAYLREIFPHLMPKKAGNA